MLLPNGSRGKHEQRQRRCDWSIDNGNPIARRMGRNKLFSNKQIAHYQNQILRGDPDPTGMRKEVEDKDESLNLQGRIHFYLFEILNLY